MWGIKSLNGPQAGQIFPLRSGVNRFGRSSENQIVLQGEGISKQHFEIIVEPQKVTLVDLNSSNGTFHNGIKVKKTMLRPGDKLSAFQNYFEFSFVENLTPPQPLRARGTRSPVGETKSHSSQPVESPSVALSPMLEVQKKIDEFLNQAFLPGIIRLAEVFDFKYVILGVSAIFVLIVALVSVFPMNQITEESIKLESQRRALTVARALADNNERAVKNQDLSAFDTSTVLREDGIEEVFIISGSDGVILAPPERAGTQATRYLSFIKDVRGQDRWKMMTISSGQVAASSPILSFDPERGRNVAVAHAVVIFNAGYLRFDDGRVFSLFIQMLFISGLLGGLLFWVLYKLVEHPFKVINQQIELSMRDASHQTKVDLRFEAAQELVVTLNSLIHRSAVGSGSVATESKSRAEEMNQIVNLCENPAILLNRDSLIVGINSALSELIGVQPHEVTGQPLQFIPDPALQQNISGLLHKCIESVGSVQSDSISMRERPGYLKCLGLSATGSPDYFLVTFTFESSSGALGYGGVA